MTQNTPQKKWTELAQRLKDEGVYHPDRLDPQLLRKQFFAGLAVMRETDEVVGNRTVTAYAALWPTGLSSCFEVGAVHVHPEHRKKGMSLEIWVELLARSPPGSSLFFITADERVGRLGSCYGFAPVTTERFPKILEWASSVGIVSRLPRSVHPIEGSGVWGVPVHGERWLYMRQPQ